MQKVITHIIIGLSKDGAETVLYNTLKYRSAGTGIEQRVISLGEGSYYAKPIRALGVSLTELNLRHYPITTFFELRKRLKGTDTLCCWMYHADLFGYLAGHGRVKKIIWNIRHSDVDKHHFGKLTWFVVKCCALLSGKPDVIAYNGLHARENHRTIGFHGKEETVLDNGCDLDLFTPVSEARASLIREYGIPADAKIIVSASRWHLYKDVPTFLRAVARIKKAIPEAIAVMCGRGIEENNADLQRLIAENGLKTGTDVILTGLRDDLPRFFSGADLYILHSLAEAFPNTLLQAMACGCPAVATDVGDVQEIFGKDGLIVPVGNDAFMADKAIELLSLPEAERTQIGMENRKTVITKYDIHKVVIEYEKLFT